MPASNEHRERVLAFQESQIIDETNWPTHPDGRRKTFGEMTTAQRTAVVRGSVARIKTHFEGE
jgi:hypothetical protein